ncbi:MAG: hypothetical protein AAGK04_03925 [Planctomycetota bacterium]
MSRILRNARSAALFSMVALPLLAAGQSSVRPTTAPERNPGFAVVELDNQAFRLPSAGLSMYLPLNSLAQTTRLGQQATVRVTPPTAPGVKPKWIMNIQTMRAPQANGSTEWIADRIIDQIRKSGGKIGVDLEPSAGSSRRVRSGANPIHRTSARLITRDPALRVGEHTADRFYVSMPAPDGDAVVHGHSVFHVANDRFITFELITREAHLPETKPVYETTVATATFVDPTEAAQRRFAAIEVGQRLMEELTESDYDAVIDGSAFGREPGGRYERWERLFTPGGTGRDSDDAEHGYKRIQTWIGFRGEMEPNRRRERWTPLEREQGYLLSMKTRLIQQTPGGPQLVDSDAIFFMSRDRQQEAWSITMALKSPDGAAALWKEIGARDQDSMTIAVEEPGATPRTIKPVIQGDGYVSRLEAFILPQLLVRGAIPTDYGFYAYQPSLQTIAFRTDSLEQPATTPGRFRLTTRLAEDLEPQVSAYEADGRLRSTTLPDGRIWRPVTLKKLYKTWQDKGLPLE